MKQEYVPDCNFGSVRLAVNTLQYKQTSISELDRRVRDIYLKNNPLLRYPMLENETKEDWDKRVKPDLDKDQIRRLGESTDDHLKRLLNESGDIHEIAFEIVTAICDVLQPGVKVSDHDFGQANWLECKLFLFDVLNLADIPCEVFIPKRPISK